MRLNLGEIALSLGCDPEQVLWRPSDLAVRQPAGSGQTIVPLKKLGQAGSGKRPDQEWGYAPWASILPTGGHFDSREIRKGNLFFCLPGERVDGHAFALDAVKAGASAIVALHDPFEESAAGLAEQGFDLPPVFLVQDVRIALWRVAACHRDTAVARVIGITGTAGKTSVKEVLAHVLAMRGLTQRNPKNFNNQLGLPVSMLNASADASFWVMEAGISEAHDMDELGAILRPDIALILNVGQGHTEGLGKYGVAASKARLLDYVQPGGIAVVSADYADLNAELDARAGDLEARAVTLVRFSAAEAGADFRAVYIGPSESGQGGRYEVMVRDKRLDLDTPFRGNFGSENVSAIYATACKLGLADEQIISGLAGAHLPEQRFFTVQVGNFVLIDDSYNANPLSMTRMIEAASTMAEEARKPLILVLGEMLELGDRAGEAHESLGEAVAEAKPQVVFWKGGHKEAVRAGLNKRKYAGDFYPVGGGQDFSLLLEELRLASGLALFKGSRGNQLERLVDIFRDAVISAGECHAV